jgi:hypothetical protein
MGGRECPAVSERDSEGSGLFARVDSVGVFWVEAGGEADNDGMVCCSIVVFRGWGSTRGGPGGRVMACLVAGGWLMERVEELDGARRGCVWRFLCVPGLPWGAAGLGAKGDGVGSGVASLRKELWRW